MKLHLQPCILLIFSTSHYEAHSTALFVTDIRYLSLWSIFQSSVFFLHSVPVIMMLFPQLLVLLSFCTCHCKALSKALCATVILYLSLWSSFHSSLCYWHSLYISKEPLPQLCWLLSFSNSHYEAPSTTQCTTEILFLSLWISLHSYLFYWISVPFILNLFQQFSVLQIFCTSHYEPPSTALCATDIVYMSVWSSFHSSVCYFHSVPFIM